MESPKILPLHVKRLSTFNETEKQFAVGCLHDLFAAQVARAPGALALIFEGRTMTYAELDARANQLARRLIGMGVRPNAIVGVCMERSPELVIALYGILKAGGAYLPLDPDYPSDRLTYMIEDANVEVLIGGRDSPALETVARARTVVVDAEFTGFTEETTAPEVVVGLDDLAYVIYTSGSTGRPKGAMIEHRAIANRICWMQDAYRLTPEDRILQKTPFSFDVSVWEFFWPLLYGATLVVARPNGHKDTEYLATTIITQGVTTMHFVPSMLRPFLEAPKVAQITSLTRVFVSGEALSADLRDRFFQRLGTELHNLYGPTEAAVDVTAWKCTAGGPDPVPIGRAISNVQLYILDGKLAPVPIGEAGELHIGGVALARGYLNRPELTEQRFIVADPLGGPKQRLYKTGDLARFRDDGVIEFLGRIDHQVKVRGFRIELGEIETQLRQDARIADAVVVAREDQSGQKRLVAYVELGARVEEDDGGAAERQVQQWQEVFDRTYSDNERSHDPTFDIAGWHSSYTGGPIPADEMRVWVESTVERILASGPQRVLEIGCGTGLLMFRIAPHVERYHGIDLSSVVIRNLEQLIAEPEHRLDNVSLEQRRADDFDGLDDDAYDAVVINSVIQLFPDADYLLRVLTGAARVVRPGGVIYVGDVRNHELMELFHTSVQLHRAPSDTPLDALRMSIDKSVRNENELLIAPHFFRQLAKRIPQVSGADIELKRGSFDNELTRFRFDARIHVGPRETQRTNWHEWNGEPSLEHIKATVSSSSCDFVGFYGVPNQRVAADVRARAALPGSSKETVGAFRDALSPEVPGFDPETLWALSEELGREVQVACEDEGAALRVLFRPRQSSGIPQPAPSDAKAGARFANAPAKADQMANVIPDLRQALGHTLPDYMIPASFVVMDQLPLTTSGKIDRKALPAPDSARPDLAVPYLEPRTAAEATLAKLWQDVLGLERVGVNDDFFELGGDSIQSIQIRAKASQQGVSLPRGDVFEHRTIARLAAARLDDAPATPIHRSTSADIPLGAYQRWFFAQSLPNPDHWNMSVLLEGRAVLDVEGLRAALGALPEQHEALSLRFDKSADGVWTAKRAEPQQAARPRLEVFTWAADVTDAEINEALTSIQKNLDLASGRLLSAGLMRRPGHPDRILLTAHHLVADGLSLMILIEDFAAAYAQATAGESIVLPPASDSLGTWFQDVERWAASPQLEQELTHWESLPASPPPLPRDLDRAPGNIEASARTVPFLLEEGETEDLLRRVPAAYNTRINDILLTAVSRTFGRWAGHDRLMIDMEGHGRAGVETVDVSRTVGCFTAVYPIVLDVIADEDPANAIKRIKEELRAVPGEGEGYGALRYLSDKGRRALDGHESPELMFNYLGQYGRLLRKNPHFSWSHDARGPEYEGTAPRKHLLLINGFVIEGRLHLEITYSQNIHDAQTIERLGSELLRELRTLIAHCVSVEQRTYTPSDFPLAGLTQSALDRILGARSPVEDLVEVSPTQHGMLFHSLLFPDSGVYFVLMSAALHGELDVEKFQRAWQTAVDRHPALRTSFLWDGVDVPLQFVHPHAQLPFTFEDLSGQSPATQAERLEALRHAPPQYSLSAAPLMHLTIARVGGEEHLLFWQFHHLILDGWSIAVLFEEIFEAYSALHTPRAPALSEPVPFSRFTRYLRDQPRAAAAAFWKARLAGFSAPTKLFGDRRPGSRPSETTKYARAEFRVSADATRRLREASRQNGLTLNSVIQGAWSIVLARGARKHDIVFGSITAGRPSGLPGAESVVGLLIHAVPVRVRIPEDGELFSWLKQIQLEHAEARPHELTALVDIQAQSEVAGQTQLFESIIALHNLPVRQSLENASGALRVTDFVFEDFNNYPLSVAVELGETLFVQVKYDEGRFAQHDVERIKHAFSTLLDVMAEARASTLTAIAAAVDAQLFGASSRGEASQSKKRSVADRLRSARRKRARPEGKE